MLHKLHETAKSFEDALKLQELSIIYADLQELDMLNFLSHHYSSSRSEQYQRM